MAPGRPAGGNGRGTGAVARADLRRWHVAPAPDETHARYEEPTVKILILLNDPPYGTERCYNGLRLAGSLVKRDGVEVNVFLFGDSVGCAIDNQKLPDGYYHLDRMVAAVIRDGGQVGCCGSCMDARGLGEDALVRGAARSTLEQATDWTLWADKVLSF